jgi:ankyrin repeat protein
LNHNASPNATDTRGWAEIHHAANNHNDVSLVQALLNKGTDINLVTRSRGDTPLHMAAKRGNDQVCAYLMNAHARLDIRNLDNKTAFECAFDNEDLSVARIISRGSLSEVIRLTIRRARPAMLKKLLSMSKDLKKDLVFPDGSTALHIACALSVEDDIDLTQGLVLGHRKVAVRAVDSELGSKQREMINLLLDTGVLTVDRVDSHGRTALHVATEWAQQVACMTLLERGASLSKTVSHRHQSDKTFTAFSLASLYNNEALMIDFCEYCITHKKEVEFTRQYPLLIALASHNSCAEVVKRLLIYAKRLSLSLAQMKNSYPLHRACLEGNEDICKYLLNEGANPEELFDKSTYDSKAFGTFWTDADGKNITPLHCAAFAGHLEICRILLRKRVPINPLTSQGRSPLYYACLANKEAVVSFLLIRGSRINAEDLEASNVELCELLLENLKRRYERLPVDERGVREEEESIVGLLRAVDQNRQTLLHREAQKGNWEKCACILDRFAPLSAVDSRGRTALHLACQIGNDGKNLLLEKYGETVKVLVGDPDTDPSFINIQDTNGETALHYACKGGADSLNVVRMLLEAGADPDLASYGMFFGKTPRTVALESKSDELIELIKGYPKQ